MREDLVCAIGLVSLAVLLGAVDVALISFSGSPANPWPGNVAVVGSGTFGGVAGGTVRSLKRGDNEWRQWLGVAAVVVLTLGMLWLLR